MEDQEEFIPVRLRNGEFAAFQRQVGKEVVRVMVSDETITRLYALAAWHQTTVEEWCTEHLEDIVSGTVAYHAGQLWKHNETEIC